MKQQFIAISDMTTSILESNIDSQNIVVGILVCKVSALLLPSKPDICQRKQCSCLERKFRLNISGSFKHKY